MAQVSVIQEPLVELQYSESIISSGDMNDIVAVNKWKRGRPPLTENEKAARLKQKEDERNDKKAKKLESTQGRREKAKGALEFQ